MDVRRGRWLPVTFAIVVVSVTGAGLALAASGRAAISIVGPAELAIALGLLGSFIGIAAWRPRTSGRGGNAAPPSRVSR
jgi:membrane protein implicated in regulation of membrane protease activity